MGAILALTFAMPAMAEELCDDGTYAATLADCPSAVLDADVEPSDINTYFRAGGTGTASDFASDAALGDQDLSTSISSIINVALGFLGVVAVVIILAGGFKWMTAGGNDDKVKSARKLLVAGLIGLIIVLAAYAIATFTIESIVTATSE